jgi:fumarate hydratase class II
MHIATVIKTYEELLPSLKDLAEEFKKKSH